MIHATSIRKGCAHDDCEAPCGTDNTESFHLIYVVDDDISVRESIADLLATVGLTVKLFTSASELFTVLETAGREAAERPGCLILDVRMPGIGGLEAQERLARLNVFVPI